MKKERTLRDERNIFSQLVQTDTPQVDTINLGITSGELNQTEEGLEDGTLASSCSTNDSNFHTGSDFAVQVLNARFEAFTVRHGYIVELEISF